MEKIGSHKITADNHEQDKETDDIIADSKSFRMLFMRNAALVGSVG